MVVDFETQFMQNIQSLEPLSADGSAVDYAAMRASEVFAAYVALSAGLQGCALPQLQQMGDVDRFCFFANLYNALIIHGEWLVCVRASVCVCDEWVRSCRC